MPGSRTASNKTIEQKNYRTEKSVPPAHLIAGCSENHLAAAAAAVTSTVAIERQ